MYLWPIRDLNILCVEVTLHVTEVAYSSPPHVHFFQSSIQAFPFPLRVALVFFCANGVSRNPWKMIQDRISLLSRDPDLIAGATTRTPEGLICFSFEGRPHSPWYLAFGARKDGRSAPALPDCLFFAEVLLNRNIKWLHLSFSSEDSALSEFSRKFLLEFENY